MKPIWRGPGEQLQASCCRFRRSIEDVSESALKQVSRTKLTDMQVSFTYNMCRYLRDASAFVRLARGGMGEKARYIITLIDSLAMTFASENYGNLFTFPESCQEILHDARKVKDAKLKKTIESFARGEQREEDQEPLVHSAVLANVFGDIERVCGGKGDPEAQEGVYRLSIVYAYLKLIEKQSREEPNFLTDWQISRLMSSTNPRPHKRSTIQSVS
ncbi:hypothetical protein SELMODRAFT_413741 [Selaginella moellendorffii]|uniref:Uncharacterized protein n=1 Tax=Selaginella moellendorffii TaxID=88036 RepID=D8RQ27_SELML|nr:hypothetical protein SELMODRAFT_413741 [Selaginella moellendorffii]